MSIKVQLYSLNICVFIKNISQSPYIILDEKLTSARNKLCDNCMHDDINLYTKTKEINFDHVKENIIKSTIIAMFNTNVFYLLSSIYQTNFRL